MIISNRAFALPGTLLGGAVLAILVGVSFTSRTTAQAGTVPAVTPSSTPAPDADGSEIVYDAAIDRLDVLFPTGVVATVHDRSITVADVRREVAPLVPRLKRDSRNQEEFNSRLAMLQNSTIKTLVDRVLLLRQFRAASPDEQPRHIATEYVDKAFADEITERFGGDRAKFLDYLKDRSMTIRDYRKEIEEQIIYNYMRGQERKLAAKPRASGGTAGAEQQITLVASDTVVVRVTRKNPDDSEGVDVMPETTLNAGQKLLVPWTTPIYIHATAGENLMIEFEGRSFPAPFKGNGSAQMAQPPR